MLGKTKKLMKISILNLISRVAEQAETHNEVCGQTEYLNVYVVIVKCDLFQYNLSLITNVYYFALFDLLILCELYVN